MWDDEGRRAGAFVIVRNLTARPLVVNSIEVQGAEPMTDHFVLQRNEEHEFTLPISGAEAAPVGPPAKVVVNGGRRVTGGAGARRTRCPAGVRGPRQNPLRRKKLNDKPAWKAASSETAVSLPALIEKLARRTQS